MSSIQGLKTRLAQLETRLQALVEGSAARFFPSPTGEEVLARRLVGALHQGIRPLADGSLAAPNLFLIAAHPAHASELRGMQGMLLKLQSELERTAQETSLRFLEPPIVQVVEDLDLPYRQVAVSSRFQIDGMDSTSDLAADLYLPGEGEPAAAMIPPNAFLIVNGVQIVPLTQPVTNIGRRPDNHLVIDDPRISRLHAQLRIANGHFLVFDLDSTGGTFVNNRRVRQATLVSGDVISLAGVPLVYGQDEMQENQTQKLPVENLTAGEQEFVP